MKFILAGAAALIGVASAQQTAWGQCGGRDWTGSTTCVSGYYCRYQDQYYSQCVPGSASTSSVSVTTTTTRVTSSTTLTTSTTRTTTSTTSSAAPPTGSYVTTSGTRFRIDGVTKYFAGTNCYYCSVGGLGNADVDLLLDHIQASGLKILRVWGFNDVNTIPSGSTTWFQHLSASGSTINTGTNGLQRLDYVVQGAERRGIKLIIPFVNNWNDYGGYRAYTQAFGGSATTWYTNTAAQAQYRRFISAVVSRYRTSTAILAWELANEPRCAGCSTDVIFNWARDASAYVKSLDSNHLVTLGDEGFGLAGDTSYPYTYAEGIDFARNLGISTLDFGTFHMYPDHWGTSYTWGNKWITDHAAACRTANKPCLLEEYGALGDHCALQRPWQVASVAAAGMAGDAFWQHGDSLSYGNTHDDGFAIFYGSAAWTCLVTNHVAAIG